MDRTRALQGIREMRFEALLERQEQGELSQMEAAELLGMSERTFRGYRDRYREDGADGLRDRRIGKPSSRRAAVEEVQRMLGLYREDYADFTVKHFHEQLTKRHNDRLGYTVTRLALHAAGLVKPAPRRSAHRRKRPRRPLRGMMLHQDASRFAWLPGDQRAYDLVVTLDDATSEIYSIFLVAEEGTMSTFRALGDRLRRLAYEHAIRSRGL
jgi:transposase